MRRTKMVSFLAHYPVVSIWLSFWWNAADHSFSSRHSGFWGYVFVCVCVIV